MTAFLIGLASIFLTIFFVIGIHEFGHFIVARLLGVKVLRFSIGFGKSLFRFHDKKGTEYVFALIPLGGYVKLLDESEGPVPPHELNRAFNRQPFYKKFSITIAGVIFNFIFAFLIYWALFVVGFISPLSIVGQVTPNSIAAKAGMKPQQEILKIDNHDTTEWTSIIVRLLSHAGDKNKMEITTRDLASNKIQVYILDLSHWKMNDLKPDPIESLGIQPYRPSISPIIGTIKPDSPAINYFKVGDKVLTVDGESILDWAMLSAKIAESPDSMLTFVIKRENKNLTLNVPVSHVRTLFLKKQGYLGIGTVWEWPPSLIKQYKYGPIEAIKRSYSNMNDLVFLNALVLKKLFTGKISLSSLGGPISIFEGAGTSLNHGLIPFFSFVAFLSISIGFINLLPIPGLDGGLILFQLIEFILRRPVSLRVQHLFFRLGLIFLLLLMSQALINDILRL